ncbi:MAG: copper chaperone [Icmadophila ericetorum]|nr:copper chaperone [Icmadophila ericetorum]
MTQSTSIPPFQTTFAVSLHCNGCIDSVTSALQKVNGISEISPSLEDQTISITGTAPPSALIQAMQSTGKDAILRGSGVSNSNWLRNQLSGKIGTNRSPGAAVAILETPISSDPTSSQKSPVRGLARFVQVSSSPSPPLTLIDLTLKGLPPGLYSASIRASGDISQGSKSIGGMWRGAEKENDGKGDLGDIKVGEDRKGSTLSMGRWAVWEVVGRGFTVQRKEALSIPLSTNSSRSGSEEAEGYETEALGVIARSAGVWDNDKTVCSCSGKTVWEEREEQVGRGML